MVPGVPVRRAGTQALRGESADDLSTVVSSVSVIGLNYAQGTALLAGFNLDWGSSVRAVFAVLKIASGAVTGSVSMGCVVSVDYATRAGSESVLCRDQCDVVPG